MKEDGQTIHFTYILTQNIKRKIRDVFKTRLDRKNLLAALQ